MNAPTPALVARPERLRLVGQRRQILAVVHQRLMFGMILYAGIIAIIVLRLVWLAAFGDHAGRRGGPISLVPPRGDIVDRDGKLLAGSIDVWSIGIHPARVIGNKLDLARELARLMPERDAADYLAMLRSDKTYYFLQRRASPQLVEAVNALGEPGLALERSPDRLYPQTSLAAHVLGFTDIDGHGAAGAERAFDQQLSDPATRGTPLTLSISSKVQQALEHELHAAMSEFSAIGAAGIVMDIHTGEVLAMTSLPDLNPNIAGRAAPEARFSRATLGVYELGSTYKPFTVAMAMDAGVVKSMGQMYSCPQQFRYGKVIVNDTHPFGRACSVAEIMKESSNIGTAQIALKLGAARQKAFLDKMGFLAPLQFELRERGRTLTPGNDWGEVATMTVGYGHGIAVTPLHLASGYATLFNGGVYRPPTILKVDRTHKVGPGRRVFTEETSSKSRALLRLVVAKGTGKKADAPGYRVGGKTGTAEKYTSNQVVTSFAGVFPMDEPRYVVVAMLDEPKATKETFGFHTAGWNVAPVISRTVSRIAPMLGVRPDMKRDANLAEVLPFVHEKEK